MLNVVCVKWGAWCHPHGARYVNNLAAGIRANLTGPYRFICFTDDPDGLNPGIEVRPLPLNLTGWWWEQVYAKEKKPFLRRLYAWPYRFARDKDVGRGVDEDRLKSNQPIDLRGWYNKLYLFKPGVLSGPTLYVDLDTVLVGNIDALASYEGDFCILRDLEHQRKYGSGLIHFRPEKFAEIWDRFVEEGCPYVFMGDQAWIQKCVPKPDFFQDLYPGHVVSYKISCQDRPIPPHTRIICFHGLPRPHEISDPFLLSQFDRT